MPVFVPSTDAPTHVGRFRAAATAGLALALGVPFLPAVFGPAAAIAVEAAFGADVNADPSSWTWYDITGDVRQADGGGISITPMGRADEASTGQPAGCGFELANDSGDYTPYHRGSRWWPGVRRNTPIRVRINLTGLAGDWVVRFQGETTGWTPSWDASAALPVVTVAATGITRRLQRRLNATKSAARRMYDAFLLTDSRAADLVGYWSLEDAAGATSAASGLPGGTPMTISGGGANGSGAVFGTAQGRTQAAYTGFEITRVGIESFVALEQGGTLTVDLPPGTATRYSFQFTAFAWRAGSDLVLLRWFTPGGAFVRYDVRFRGATDNAIELTAYNAAGAGTKLVESDIAFVDEFEFSFEVSQNGANVDTFLDIYRFAPSVGFIGSSASDTRAGTVVLPTRVVLNPDGVTITPAAITGSENQNTGLRFGHLAAWYSFPHVFLTNTYTSAATGIEFGAWNGWDGESAVERIARLCGEQRITLDVTGTSDTAMGFQGVDAFLALLRECEAADQGVLFDGLGPGLGYVSRDARYNATPALTVDAAARQLDDPFEPVDDDQRDINLAKVARKAGSSYTYQQVPGPKGTGAVGVYDTAPTVNVHSDAVLPLYASWFTHLGTVDGFRYPRLNLDLRTAPAIAAGWLAAGISGRINVDNVSDIAPEHPAGTIWLLLEGWAEQLTPFYWAAQANTSRYDGWQVGVLAAGAGDTSPLLGHLETDNSTTNGATTAGALTISVVTNAGPIWSTASDLPFDVLIDGQRISIASITGGSSPQTFNVDPAGSQVLYQIAAGTPVVIADPIIPAL